MNDEHDILYLKQGKKSILKKVYLNNKAAFMKFASAFGLKNDLLEDIYQDAIIVLYEKAMTGKLDNLTCSLKTYLFSIGKYMVFEHTRKQGKMQLTSEDYVFDQNDYSLINEIHGDQDMTGYQKLLADSIEKLGDKCREILRLFYYQSKTIEEITQIQGYESKNVTKSQKSRCLKSLKELIKTK